MLAWITYFRLKLSDRKISVAFAKLEKGTNKYNVCFRLGFECSRDSNKT